ncbi:MAG: extracellular solute-binding protein [Deinococcales bacterium]
MPIFISEGLLEPIHVQEMPNFANVDPRWHSPSWDADNVYTVPWQWGTTSFAVDTDIYGGDIDSYEVLFNPPTELQGKINMFNSPDEVVAMTLTYLGYELCSSNPDHFKAVSDVLQAQKPFVKTYTSEGILDSMVAGEYAMSMYWNGATMRVRAERPSVRYAYPKEGVISWMDNLAIPKGARNQENAMTFINWFLTPEHAAMQSNFARYANGVAGSEAFMDDELKTAPEIVLPEGAKTLFGLSCPEDYIRLTDRVWTRLKQ